MVNKHQIIKIILIVVIILSVITIFKFFINAKTPNDSNVISKYRSTISKNETPYFVDDRTYLNDKNPEIIAIKKVIQDYEQSQCRNFQTINGEEIYKYCTSDKINQLKSVKYAEQSVADYKKYEVIREYKGIDSYNVIAFNKDFTIAQAKYVNEFSFKQLTDEYIKKDNVKINTLYKTSMEVDFQKQNGEWKISNWTNNGFVIK